MLQFEQKKYEVLEQLNHTINRSAFQSRNWSQMQEYGNQDCIMQSCGRKRKTEKHTDHLVYKYSMFRALRESGVRAVWKYLHRFTITVSTYRRRKSDQARITWLKGYIAHKNTYIRLENVQKRFFWAQKPFYWSKNDLEKFMWIYKSYFILSSSHGGLQVHKSAEE